MSKSLSSSSHSFISSTGKTDSVYIFIIGNIQSFTSQILGAVSPLEGENRDSVSSLEFDSQINSDHERPKIKLYLVKASKHYLNDKNLIYVRFPITMELFQNLLHGFL